MSNGCHFWLAGKTWLMKSGHAPGRAVLRERGSIPIDDVAVLGDDRLEAGQ
jgi:hypothetical protein